MTTTELITWHAVASGVLPDADMTVMVETIGCEEPVWLGCLDGEQWRDVDGMPIEVLAWADLPLGTRGIAAAPPRVPAIAEPA